MKKRYFPRTSNKVAKEQAIKDMKKANEKSYFIGYEKDIRDLCALPKFVILTANL